MSYPRRKIIKALEKYGFHFLREGGNHTIYGSAEGRRIQVPRHKEVKRGTARDIADQAGIERREFERSIS